mmetsp:Transcript_23826/g.94458  ORF Transcript_23826/g.94458 Transcript_23826/m.94458 type:complete len:408 (-) Transcript_23826:783-2006(-)
MSSLRARRRVAPGVPHRRRHRPHRVPQVRPQRDRRTDLHAADDVPGGQQTKERPRQVCRALRRDAPRHPGRRVARRRRPRRQNLQRRVRPARGVRLGPRHLGAALGFDKVPARSRPRRVRQDGRRRGDAQEGRQGADDAPRGLRRPPPAQGAARPVQPGDGRRGPRAVGFGRAARLRDAALGGHPRAVHGAGRRARDVHAPARRRPRPKDGRQAHVPQRHRPDAVGAPLHQELVPLGVRRPRLRARVLDGDAQRARHLGSAVWRFRQRRADHHRPVPLVGRGQVDAPVGPRVAPPARLPGPGPRALVVPHRALPPVRRRGPRRHPGGPRHARGPDAPGPAQQLADRQPVDARELFPLPPPAAAPRVPQAARRRVDQGAPAPQARGLVARRVRRRLALPADLRRDVPR